MYYRLKITPEWSAEEETVSLLHIEIKTDRGAEKGKPAFARITQLVGIPFCPVEEGPVMEDEKGNVPFETRQLPPVSAFIHPEVLLAGRDTDGEVALTYTVSPRVQPENYRSSPYFDLVAEKGGVNGVGNTFLYFLPEIKEGENSEDSLTRLHTAFDLSWDLSRLPEGCSAVWTFSADGNAHKDDFSQMDVLWTAYMCGKIRRVEHGSVGFYWFDTLPFPAQEGADRVTRMFAYMARMWHDRDGDYRVFARHNHFPGGGGTALTRSYIYGYGKDDKVELDDLQDLLAHEMTHNWPAMSDNPPGTSTWYVEGSAEFYSTMVPMEMGIRSVEKTAEVINDKAGAYWKNPLHTLSNLELGKIYWTDRRAQRVPYARGILFLSNCDARIRRETGGKHSLLDVELALLQMEDPRPEDFLNKAQEISGIDFTADYEKMCAGEDPVPDPEAFGGHFDVTKAMVHENDHQHVVDYTDDGKLVPGYVWTVKKEN